MHSLKVEKKCIPSPNASMILFSLSHAHIGGAGRGLERQGSITYSALTAPQAKVTEGITSSAFEIAALATIPSDNAAHKVC